MADGYLGFHVTLESDPFPHPLFIQPLHLQTNSGSICCFSKQRHLNVQVHYHGFFTLFLVTGTVFSRRVQIPDRVRSRSLLYLSFLTTYQHGKKNHRCHKNSLTVPDFLPHVTTCMSFSFILLLN
jgi:hypothetical protein